MINAFQSCLSAIAAVTMLAAAGCERRASKPIAVVPATESSSAPVVAQPDDTPALGGNHNPAEGSAIGGVPANQEGGGVRKGAPGDSPRGAAEPTGGDGAASAGTR